MAMVVDAFVGSLAGKLMKFAEGEMSMLLGVKDEIKKLLRRLERLRVFLQYAEQKRYMDSHIAALVKELRDVMYDADDILDTCMMEGGKLLGVEKPTRRAVRCSHLLNMFCSCFRCLKYRHEVGLDIIKLNDRIDEIAKDSQITATITAHTGQSDTGNQRRFVPSLSSRQTSPIQDDTNIVGTQIEEAAKKVMSHIVDENDDDKVKCRIFAITGMGGIGKTTLARKIFNHQKITRNFPAEPSEEKTTGTAGGFGKIASMRVLNDGSNLPQPQPNDEKVVTSKFSKRRIWLHVSKNYSEIELLKEIVRNLGGVDKGEKSRAELEDKLKSLVPESLFLVLDDVWSADVWYKLLKDPMISHRATKFRVLITTRDEAIGRDLKAKYTHHVDRMDKDSGWELLCKEVFEDGEEEEIQSLRDIGYQIVEKCDGLPIAIKALAGVLRLKDKDEGDWGKVLRSEMWSMNRMNDEVPSALYMSYEDLSPELKQCFLYCSLLSANGGMHKTDLLTYWIDEGFVPTEEAESPSLMEETAEKWYRELMWRNLLQRDPDYLDDKACIMHDLLRSLGQVLIEGEAICISGDDDRVCTSPLMKLRRLIMTSYAGETLTLPDCVTEPEHLRTLFFSEAFQINCMGDDLIGKLRNLRILMLSDTNIEELPNSIGSLFHLRHLDLDRTKIKEIPRSIGGLSNLQTLRASGCPYLHQLPSTITSLHKLRVLYVRYTPLSHVPKGIGRLQNLNWIEGLVIGHNGDLSKQEEKGCDLDELQHLSNLRVLRMHKLHRSNGEISTSTIADKSFLQHLVLSEQATNLSEAQTLRAQETYNCLIPPSSIRRLEMHNFPGLEFPRWIMSPSLVDAFPNLSTLFLQNATSCRELPPQLSHLPRLKVIQIKSANAITNIGPQFFSRGPKAIAFPKLERMTFWKMPKWEEWSSLSDDDEEVDQVYGVRSTSVKRHHLLPNLHMITLLDCPKLKTLPRCLSLAPNLKKLWIEAGELRQIDNLPLLSDTMYVVQCEKLERVCNLPSLKHLAIHHCPRLEHVDNLDALQHLLVVTSADNLPQWLSQLILQPFFIKFEMHCTLELFNDCLRNGPNWHIIQQIPQVSIRSFDESMYMRYTKDPYYSYEVGENQPTDDDSNTDDGDGDNDDDGIGDDDGKGDGIGDDDGDGDGDGGDDGDDDVDGNNDGDGDDNGDDDNDSDNKSKDEDDDDDIDSELDEDWDFDLAI